MKNPLIVALIALVLGAAALVTSLLDRSSFVPRDAVESVAVTPESSGSLGERLEELTAENRALRDRLTALEMRPVDVPRVPVTSGFVPREEFDAFCVEVRDALAGTDESAAQLAGTPEVFKEQVASTLTEIRRAEADAKALSLQTDRVVGLDRTMPKIETWLELTPQQSTRMRSALLAQYDREAELTRRWQAGEDPAVLGELKRSDGEVHIAELAGFLTTAQFERYTAGQRVRSK
jgi:hypothetical protein